MPTYRFVALVEDEPGVSSSDFTERKTSSTRHSCLYFNATSTGARSVLVVNTHLPSYRASRFSLSSSHRKLLSGTHRRETVGAAEERRGCGSDALANSSQIPPLPSQLWHNHNSSSRIV